MSTTCQICERAIRSKAGVIAHHGYQRPHGEGWQTSSCIGARHLPYEVSRDLIPDAIDHCKRTVAAITADIAALEARNTKLLRDVRKRFDGRQEVTIWGRYGTGMTHDYTLELAHSEPGTDDHEHLTRVRIAKAEGERKFYEREIARLQRRYDNWIATAEVAA